MAIDTALQRGLRGLRGGTTLVRLLSRSRGARDRRNPPRLTIGRILAWADAHRRRNGVWPSMLSGPVFEDRGETWGAINDALFRGSRGLRGGSSIARLLAKHRGRRHKHEAQRLTVARILAWADAHRRRTGDWPSKLSGPVRDAPGETWSGIDDALKRGGRGLPGGSSLPKLLAARRGRRHVRYQPPVTGAQILTWVDDHYKRHGVWPSAHSGPVHGAPGENWASIDKALEYGRRGLRGGTTLPRFLARHRGRPYQSKGPPLTEARIVRWARAHRARTGRWPTPASGPVAGVRGEHWQKVNHALSAGLRGLTGGTTLLKLLGDRCGARHPRFPPRLNEKQILAWADAHRRRTGDWPTETSGPVAGAPGETWSAIQGGLSSGGRGLHGGSSIARLLARHRGRRHKHEAPRLTQQQVLAWADAHRARTGDWPAARSGPVAQADGETWSGVNSALTRGQRGLKGGMTLVGLLARHRGRRDQLNPPRLTQQQILAWADAFYARTGDWPSRQSGRLEEDRHERWSALNAALVKGIRGLRGGSSLVKLLSTHRRVLYRRKGLPLARSDILEWAAAHHELTGRLPDERSGPVRGAPGENWAAIDAALRAGTRTLPGRSSLAELLETQYVEPYEGVGQRLSAHRILAWADAFRERVGRWPTKKSAFVDPSRRERWSVVDLALREGHRGLPGGSSLARLLKGRRRNRRAAAGRGA